MKPSLLAMINAFLILILSLAWAVSPAPTRFEPVASELYRSGAPETAADYAHYRAQGITTIIDLRQGPEAAAEKAVAERLGFQYINIPLHIGSTPSDYVRAEREFFRVIDHQVATTGGGIVFHCKHGKDRTGLMAALYRVQRQGWTPERAIEEWRSMGGFGDDWGNGIQSYFLARVRIRRPLTCFDLFR